MVGEIALEQSERALLRTISPQDMRVTEISIGRNAAKAHRHAGPSMIHKKLRAGSLGRRIRRGAGMAARKVARLPMLYSYTHDEETLVRFVGQAEPTDKTRTLAICWRMNAWKHEAVAKFLPEFDVCFVDFHAPPTTLEKVRPDLLDRENVLFLTWGEGSIPALHRLAGRKKIPVWQVEDGFLRSVGPGDLHTRPNSLVFDKTGIYFDASQPSDLEVLLNGMGSRMAPDLSERARAGIEIFKAGRLSKYYSFVFDKPDAIQKDTHCSTTLVVGQMEGDASIRHGYPASLSSYFRRRFTNGRLATEVAVERPSDQLLYKPHPDTVRRRRKRVPNSVAAGRFEVVDALAPLPPLLEIADRIATQTSLVGMEALIHGKEVSTYGLPFYAGWGLTTDKLNTPRRRAGLSLEQLFAGAYLLYPRYLHPASDELSDFFEVASYFIVEQLKHRDLNAIDNHIVDVDLLRSNGEFLSAPAKLLLYLTTVGIAEADPLTVADLSVGAALADLPQFAHLLARTSNYDALKSYVDRSIADLNKTFETVVANRLLMENVLTHIGIAQRNSNGRVLAELDDHGDALVDQLEGDERYTGAVVEYARVQSNALLYDRLGTLLDRIESMKVVPYGLMQRLCSVLGSAPSRSERKHAYRRALLVRAVRIYRDSLDRAYTTRYDLLLNAALSARAEENPEAVERAMERLRDAFADDGFHLSHPNLKSFGDLAKREAHMVIVFEYLLKTRRFEYAYDMAKNSFYRGSLTKLQRSKMRGLWLSYYSALGDHRKVLSIFNRAPDIETATVRSVGQYARALRGVGELAQAKTILVGQRAKLKTPGQRLGFDIEVDKLSFALATSSFLSSYPQPKFPTGVVFLASQTCYNTLAMMTPALYELKRRGYAFVNLMEGMTAHEPTGLSFIDQFAGAIPMRFHGDGFKREWLVDWPNKRVEADGVNYYQGFYERLSTQARTYFVDINQDAVNRSFMTQLRRVDFALDVAQRICDEVVGRGLNACLVTGNSHVTPFSAFRDYARAKDHPKLNFINCNVAYESYFSNLGGKFATTMAVTDMTLHRDRRAPFMALRSDFDRWYEANRNDASFRARADEMITTNRNSSTSSDAQDQLIGWLSEERASGKKVLCAFGKVPVDLNVPYDGGPAHEEMADWLNHTVQIARDCPDLILLVKPHPHELRPEIALDLIEGFTDLIDGAVPANVRLLGHREINVHALAPHLDLALLWNGSSSLELTALGIPVLMAAYFGRHDYPVDLIYPNSRDQYAAYLKAGNFPLPSFELRERAAFLIAYMGTDEISIRNEYSYRQITNDKVGIPRWRKAEVEEFMASGDEGIAVIADRMVEKFTAAGS